MPNWCTNSVTISHKDTTKIAAMAEAMREGKFLSHVIPVPEDLQITAGFLGHNTPEQAELEAKEQANLQKYGVKNWYDFCVNRWGTKWDVDCDGIDVSADGTTVTAGFESAWAPPMGIYEMLVDEGYEVVAYYYEPGMAFVGKFDNGDDECYDYGGHNSTTVVDAIGEELDEMFGISESMREYEDEEKEEVQLWYEDGVEKLKAKEAE